MRTPYPELQLDTTVGAAITAYTAGVIRARLDYYLNPFAACGVTDCDQLRSRGRMCSRHAGPNYRGSKEEMSS